MAKSKQKGERASGEEPARRSEKKVATKKGAVKRSTLAKSRSAAAKRGAETRKREDAYRARVAAARAQEQRVRALADKRRAARELRERIATEQAAANAALEQAQQRAAALAELPTVSPQEIRDAKRRVQQAEIERGIVEQSVRADTAQQVQEIRTGRELLEQMLGDYYVKAQEDEIVRPLNPRHPSGKTWRHESRVRTGAVVDRKVGSFLREGTLESMVRRLVRAAQKAKTLQPNGRLYVSFSIFEYGRNVPKSPGPSFYQDAIGSFWQAYEGTSNLTPASDIAGFEAQIRSILEARLRSSGSGNAVLIDTFQVKSFYERSESEQRTFATERRRARRVTCGAKHPTNDLSCTRILNHEGDHVARDTQGRLLARWKQ